MKSIQTKIVIVLGILVFQTLNSNAYWNVVHTVSTKGMWNIAFADNNTVYAVGDSLLMKSADGGNNWIDLLPNISTLTTDKKFYNLKFFNKDTGLIYRNTFTENLLMTTDGGSTWSDVSPNVMPHGILNLNFVNDTVGYAVGGFSITGIPDSIFSRTTDGGHTWSHISMPMSCDFPMAVHFLTDSIGFIADERIYKTTDAGATWTLTTSLAGWTVNGLYSNFFTDYYFFDQQKGLALKDSWDIYKTNDGGNTWEPYHLPVSPIGGCRNIVFDQNYFGYVVGYGLFQPFISTDGGNTWVIDGSYSPYYPATCVSVSGDHKVIIGTREGDVVLNEHSPLSTTRLNDNTISAIYPNPSTGIIYLDTHQPITSIEVVNFVGTTMYKASPISDKNRMTIDLSAYPKGMYILKINSDGYTEQKKVVLE